MSGKTTIEWTDASWNPLRASTARVAGATSGKAGWACVRVSQGCVNCYAATFNKRLGTGLDYTVPALAQVTTYVDLKALVTPLSWRKARRVFVCSMTDLFGDWVSDLEIDQVFGVMSACRYLGRGASPGHTFQVLTKRPERMREYLLSDRANAVASHAAQYGGQHDADAIYDQARRDWPAFPHIWLGTSVEDQRAADERIPHLLATPAAVRFLSCEPLLGPIDLSGPAARATHADALIHWVIVGGESGPRARPMDLAWARSLRDQCTAAGVSMFMKQMGSNPCGSIAPGGAEPVTSFSFRESHGRDMAEWPVDLRVRTWPQ